MIKKILFIAFVALSSVAMVAQTTVTGTVKDAKTGETLPGANIKVSRKLVGTSTDFDGNFVLKVTDNPPFTLEITMLGFQTAKVEITKNNEKIEVALTENATSLDEIVVLAEDKEEFLSAIPAIQPVKNEDLKHMASGYGYRTDPFTKVRKFHFGMDFTAPRGTPVYASGDGVILRADNNASGYGKHIRIDHGHGYMSLYAHLYKYNVRSNQKVKRGDLIGFVGSTGRSEAPHLHYEVFKDGERINPINFYYGNLSADEYARLLEKASLENQSLD